MHPKGYPRHPEGFPAILSLTAKVSGISLRRDSVREDLVQILRRRDNLYPLAAAGAETPGDAGRSYRSPDRDLDTAGAILLQEEEGRIHNNTAERLAHSDGLFLVLNSDLWVGISFWYR